MATKKPTIAELRASFMAANVQAHKNQTTARVGFERAGIKLSPVRQAPTESIRANPLNKFKALDRTDQERLTEGIRRDGILTPLFIYPDPGYPATKGGRIIAGHNRYLSARILDLKTVPVQYIEQTLTLAEEERLIISDNLLRRQLSPADKAHWLNELIKTDPKKSNRRIAREAGLDHKTVGTARRKLEDAGEIKPGKKRIDTKGRAQPVTRRDVGKFPTSPELIKSSELKKSPQGKTALKVSGPIPVLSEILEAVEAKHKSQQAKACLADLKSRLIDAGFLSR